MARSFSAVKSARGKKIKCGRCQAKVEPGQKYFYFAVGFRGTKQIRCEKHPPRQSELCGSKLSGAYAAIEGCEDDIQAFRNGEDFNLADSLNTCADEIEGVRDEYQEGIDAMPESLQQTAPGLEIIESLNSFADSLRSAAENIEEEPGDVSDEKKEEWRDSNADIAEQALGEASF